MTDHQPETPRNADEPALPSQYESGTTSPPEQSSGSPTPENRDHAPRGLERRGDLSRPVEGTPPNSAAIDGDDGEPSLEGHVAEGELVEEAERLAPLILAQIQQHLHLPMQMPDAAALAQLRESDPEAHAMWLTEVKEQLAHQRFMESARYRMPMRVIEAAQRNALFALVVLAGVAVVAIVCGYPWLGALFGAIDVAGIVGLFLAATRADPEEPAAGG